MNSPYMTLARAARLLPGNNGQHPHPSTLYRWCVKGIDGVLLEHKRFGKKIYTTEKALDTFGTEVARVKMEAPMNSPAKGQPSRRRKKRIDDAQQYLKDQGLLQ